MGQIEGQDSCCYKQQGNQLGAWSSLSDLEMDPDSSLNPSMGSPEISSQFSGTLCMDNTCPTWWLWALLWKWSRERQIAEDSVFEEELSSSVCQEAWGSRRDFCLRAVLTKDVQWITNMEDKPHCPTAVTKLPKEKFHTIVRIIWNNWILSIQASPIFIFL
jgi:hypothetical protein